MPLQKNSHIYTETLKSEGVHVFASWKISEDCFILPTIIC